MSALTTLAHSYFTLFTILAPLYGIFFCLFAWSTYLSIKRQRRINAGATARSLRKPVWTTVPFVASCLLFATITPLWVLNICEAFQAFISSDGGKASQGVYYTEALPMGLSVTVLSQLVPMIGDTIMIYRLFILWNRSRLVILLPVMALVGVFALDIVIDTDLGRAIGGLDLSVNAALKDIIPPICTLSLFVNLYCCALISWEMCRHMPAQAFKATVTRVSSVLAIFVESAALYAAFMVIYVGVYASGAVAQVIFGEIIVPITGIAFTLISVRVGLGYAGIAQNVSTAPIRFAGPASFAEDTIVISIRQDVELDSFDGRKIRGCSED